MLAEHGLLDEHEPVGLQFLDEHLGHGPVDAAVEVHADAHVRAHGLAHGGHVLQAALHLVERVHELHFFRSVHLHRGEAPAHRVAGLARGLGRPVATDPAVDADAVAHAAAQQLGHRHAQGLALDVPQRLVDAGQRAHVDATAAVEAAAVEHRPVVLDVARVLADEVVGQFLHGGGHGVGTAFEDGLAPAVDAFVGFDLQEAPARRHQERGQSGDLHGRGGNLRKRWLRRERNGWPRRPARRPVRRCGPCRRRRARPG